MYSCSLYSRFSFKIGGSGVGLFSSLVYLTICIPTLFVLLLRLWSSCNLEWSTSHVHCGIILIRFPVTGSLGIPSRIYLPSDITEHSNSVWTELWPQSKHQSSWRFWQLFRYALTCPCRWLYHMSISGMSLCIHLPEPSFSYFSSHFLVVSFLASTLLALFQYLSVFKLYFLFFLYLQFDWWYTRKYNTRAADSEIVR